MDEITIKLKYHGVQDYDNIMYEVKKRVDKYNDEGYQAVKNLVELSIKTKTLITLVQNQHRGFGKTALLAEKSNELSAVLLVANENLAKALRLNGYDAIHLSDINNLRGHSMIRFLVDEGVSSEIIKGLTHYAKSEFLGGFHRL